MTRGVEYRSQLPTEVRFGCAHLDAADGLDLADAAFIDGGNGRAIVLLDSPSRPDGRAFVAVRMYRLPLCRVGFESDYDRFCKAKKARCRLPDRTAVTDDTLALVDPPSEWIHDARPQSGRSLVHVYRSRTLAVILQIGIRAGAMPDHPLIRLVREHLRFDPGTWIVDRPPVRRVAIPTGVPAAPKKPRMAKVSKRRAQPTTPAPRAAADARDPAERAGQGAADAPPWRGAWPGTDSIQEWMLALLRVADGIADVEQSSEYAIPAIEKLGRIGDGKAAIPHVDENLGRLSPARVSEVLRLVETGADVCFRAGDLAGMERYLAIATATEPSNTRKVDVGWSVGTVRRFRARRGILEPADAVDEDERRLAALKQAGRLFREALAAGDAGRARTCAETMSAVARSERNEWRRRDFLREVIAAWAELDAVAEVRRHLNMIEPDDRHTAIDSSVLVRLGLAAEAVPRLRAAMRRNLAAAADATNLNAHHDIDLFVRNLRRLDELGDRHEARRWLRRAAKAHGRWTSAEAGAFSAAVAGSLAEAATSLGDVVIARQLLAIAKAEAKQERRSPWRESAVGRWMLSPANAGMVEAALDEARRIRTPRKRRQKLASLLALTARWEELHELLDSIPSAAEAVEVVWWLHFVLPGADTV